MAVPFEWTNSALSALERCGEYFQRRYIEREYVPPSPRMLRGTVVHSVSKTALLRKMAVQLLPTVEEAQDLAASEFERNWQGGVSLSDEELATGAKTIAATSKDFAVDLSGFYVVDVAPVIEPIGVERHIIVKPRDSDLTIHGTLDLVASTPHGEAVHDLKTSEKSPNKSAADTSQQLSMYALLRLAEVGQLPAHLILDYLVRTPARQEKKHVVLETTRTRDDMQAMVNRLNVAVDAVNKGVFIPADQSSWWCSKTWCPFFETCMYVAKGRP